MEIFETIKGPSRFDLREKGSRFFALSYPISDIEEVSSILKEIKGEYYDATHHCYAYRLVGPPVLEKGADAGEPNGTAGLPILNAIRGEKLWNVLVVVIRYYGGTKLGTRGLIDAYGESAKESLKSAERKEEIQLQKATLKFEYAHVSDFHILASRLQVKIKSFEQEVDGCSVIIEGLEAQVKEMLEAMKRFLR